MVSRFKLAISIELILIAAFLTFIFIPPITPLSPLSLTPPKTYPSHPKSYKILGFVPYWNLKKLTPESLSVITDYGYFALHLDSNGSVQTHVNRRELEPGYLNYTRLRNNLPTLPIVLTFMQADEDALLSILNNSNSRRQAVTTMLTRAKEINAAGINVDFEPTSEITTSLRNNFTALIKDLKQRAPPTLSISISMYPSAASRPRLWDLARLADYTDYFVAMTYDYTMPRSISSGPNSPLRDAGGNFEHSIVKNIAELSELIPSQKILLGIPLYGYEWDTVDDSRYSPTLGRGVTASLERIQKLLDERSLSLVWDRNTLTAYGIATSSGQTSQIYFDNEVSLRLKLDFVRDAGLGGIAIWALGYDGGVPWLWPTIRSLNN